jgi:hypothetical protein
MSKRVYGEKIKGSVETKCLHCNKVFKTYPSRIKNGLRKYCSKKCYSLSMVGRKLPEHIKKITNKNLTLPKTYYKESEHFNWKGDNVGYRGLHYWINRELGKPIKCTFCNSTNNLEWANKSHEYNRDKNDYFSLCKSCHKKYDNNHRRLNV